MGVIYQIYPLSFLDTNQDGIGDIRGIIQKIKYLKELGAQYIWITPIFKSPMEDNGYDISDYYKIHPMFGNMDDLKELISIAKEHKIKIILDLVLNHTSTKHHWFKEAKKDINSKYHDYYIWSNNPPKIDSIFGGSAWEYIKKIDKYYLHMFSIGQADLNWKNKQLREELYQMINYYIDMGVGGFRLDVLDLIGKDLENNNLYNSDLLLTYLKELNERCFKGKDIFTVGEMNLPLERAHYLSKNEILTTVFQFNHIALDEVAGKGKWELKKLELNDLKKVLNQIQEVYQKDGMPSLFWSNHDQPRALGRYLNLDYRYYGQTMLFMLMYLQKGHIFIYQGEEFGMSGLGKVGIDKYQDIEAINYYNIAIKTKPVEEVLESLSVKARDHARTPMQWNDSKYAGFSQVKPWMDVNQNYHEVNFEKDYYSEKSIYKFLKKLLEIRQNNSVFDKGLFKPVDLGKHIFAYERVLEDNYLVVCNFSDKNQPFNKIKGEILLNNYNDINGVLRPYQALLIKRR
ncbi:MAG: alpha-glucosidase [Acholeplasmataceae bacterium]|jgi:oligo-1,6-glucosidase/glucan 1,6-alpha-glucosidase|nr:alpha-glucosidase [Acholeplasmataceae bacterium]